MNQDTPLLPIKNKYSLYSYYLGFASIIPLVGLVTTVLAIVFGMKALKFENQQHVSGAKAHAIVGIVLACFFGLFHYGITLSTLVSVLQNIER